MPGTTHPYSQPGSVMAGVLASVILGSITSTSACALAVTVPRTASPGTSTSMSLPDVVASLCWLPETDSTSSNVKVAWPLAARSPTTLNVLPNVVSLTTTSCSGVSPVFLTTSVYVTVPPMRTSGTLGVLVSEIAGWMISTVWTAVLGPTGPPAMSFAVTDAVLTSGSGSVDLMVYVGLNV